MFGVVVKLNMNLIYAGDYGNIILFCLDQVEIMLQYENTGLNFDYSINQYYQAVSKILNYYAEFKHDLSKLKGMKKN